MAAWFILIVPMVILFFALFMERVERRLRDMTVAEEDVEEFLEQARPDEVRALYGHGIGRALDMFRGRRSPRRAGRQKPVQRKPTEPKTPTTPTTPASR